MLSLHQEAARVVGKVALPVVELPGAKEDLVVVARGEEDAVAVMPPPQLRLRLRLRLPLLSSGVLDGVEGAEGLAAARLETVQDPSQMLFDMLTDKENAMEVVGHKLKGNNGDFRVVAWDAAPLFADCHPKR